VTRHKRTMFQARNVRSAMQIFRYVEQFRILCTRIPRYANSGGGGPYRDFKEVDHDNDSSKTDPI